MKRNRARRQLLLGILMPALLAGCSPLYILRAGYEEGRILWRRQPIDELLAASDLPADARAKLELVLRVRDYARDQLGLSVNGSYSSVTTIDADQMVHVVTAAERWQLIAYRWWFPLIGEVPYKGYFNRAEAEQEARRLDLEGYDTLVRSAAAFSTLGWFDDPLPRHLLALREIDLANLIIHELLHSTIYLPDRVDFNESFANFVGHRGAAAFFAEQGDLARSGQAEAEWQRALRYSDQLEQLRVELAGAYARRITLEQRSELFAAAQRTLVAAGLGERPMAYGIANNAVLMHELLYNNRLISFETLWQACQGNLRNTIAAVRAVASPGRDPYAGIAAVPVGLCPSSSG